METQDSLANIEWTKPEHQGNRTALLEALAHLLVSAVKNQITADQWERMQNDDEEPSAVQEIPL